MNYETGTTPPVKIVAGTEFVHARIELISDAGSQRLGGLSIGYDAGDTVSATAIDELVLAMNRARLVPNKAANLPLTFYADSACSLKVSLLSSTSSGDITMGALTWNNHSHTLTPSQHWREFNTRAQAHESSPHRLIVNMYSDDKSAMWFLPILGGSMIATGDHDMFIFSDSAIAHNESGGIHDLMTGFRTAQSFDDQSNLRFESRIQLANGVVSMPAIHYWNNEAIE